MKIGIILAMEEELNAIKKYVSSIKVNKVYNLEFIEGIINNKEVVLCKCGIGKVNAARSTQLLIDIYNPSYIINIGVAGGVGSRVSVGDIVIGESLVQHDFDITKFGHEKGYITGVGKEIYSDKYLIDCFKDSNEDLIIGTIASGDIFCTDPNMSLKINKKFNADCVEMEGASIAQVCFLCNIPFIVIRSISDVVNGNNQIDFDTFLTVASRKVADLLVKTIDKINI